MNAMPSTDIDTNPPVPIVQYDHAVRRVNMGYEFIFELTHAFLRAQGKRNLDLLVVGAGGGAEIERFLPHNPGWRITGVDPSLEMLDLARGKAEGLGVADRVTLIQGSIDDVPVGRRFDAATCLYVLHFLADDAKLALLHGITQHLHPGAPAVTISGCRVDELTSGDMREDLRGTWQQYAELRGMPAERARATIDNIVARQAQAMTEEGYRTLMHEAGFSQVVTLLSIMHDAMCAWIAR